MKSTCHNELKKKNPPPPPSKKIFLDPSLSEHNFLSPCWLPWYVLPSHTIFVDCICNDGSTFVIYATSVKTISGVPFLVSDPPPVVQSNLNHGRVINVCLYYRLEHAGRPLKSPEHAICSNSKFYSLHQMPSASTNQSSLF